MKCPVCENQVMKYEKICPHCGWMFVEDVTVYGALFGNIQLEAYQASHQQCLEVYGQSLKNFHVSADPKGDDAAISAEQKNSKDIEEQYGIDGESWYEIFQRSMRQEFGDHLAEEFFRESEDSRTRKQSSSMPVYQWLNWQLRGQRNLQTVLEQDLQRYQRLTGERRALIDEICDRIANGSFENLYVGDYFDVKLDDGEKVRLLLAGFGKADRRHTYVNQYGEPVEYYAVVVPENCFKKKESMNKFFVGPTGKFQRYTMDDQFEYKGTYLYNKVLPEYAKKLQKVLKGNILRRLDSIELELLNASQLNDDPKDLEHGGFPLFFLHPERKEAGCGFDGKKKCPYWINEQYDWGYFLNNEGQSIRDHAKLGVRPYFYIG